MDERERLDLIRQATAALHSVSRDHGWGSPATLAAHRVLLDVERTTAAEMGLPHAAPIDLGARWDTGAPMPCLLSGLRTFVIYYLRSNDRVLDQQGFGEPGWDQEHGVGVIEFHGVTSIKIGSPNEEVLHGHPLSGHGLELYAVNLVSNSPWIRELADLNRAHPRFREESWVRRRHYVLPFHDETVECVARDAKAWTDPRAMDDVVRELSSDALKPATS
jgi:hypothetical protein